MDPAQTAAVDSWLGCGIPVHALVACPACLMGTADKNETNRVGVFFFFGSTRWLTYASQLFHALDGHLALTVLVW